MTELESLQVRLAALKAKETILWDAVTEAHIRYELAVKHQHPEVLKTIRGIRRLNDSDNPATEDKS
jgi:hypothetical protein